MAINSSGARPFSEMQSGNWISQVRKADLASFHASIDDAFTELSAWAHPPTSEPSSREQTNRYANRQIVANTISAALKQTPPQNSLNLSFLSDMPDVGILPEALITLLHLHPHIKNINLAGYPKISLPESFFGLPKDLNIDLSGAQLRHVIFKDIHERMQDVSYQGPRFFNYPELPERPTPEALKTDLESWTQEAPTPELVAARKKQSDKIVKLYDQVDKPRTCLILNGQNCDALAEEATLLVNTALIDVAGNSFTTLPRSLFKALNKLEQITCDRNQLTHFPDGLEGLSELNSLSAKGNRLTEVPSGLAELPKLQYLNLARNRISQVDIKDLSPRISNLDLSRKGPAWVDDPYKSALKSLSIPEGALPQLEILDLNGNSGLTPENIPPSIFTLGFEQTKRPVLNFSGTGVQGKEGCQMLESKAIAAYAGRENETGLEKLELPYPTQQYRL